MFICTSISMALKAGDAAPDFTLPSTAGTPFTLSRDAAGQAVVLAFYPADFTPICTAEMCSFRDGFEGLKNLGVPVYGISRDDIATHDKFRAAHHLPFHLLSDPDYTVLKAFGLFVPLLVRFQRITLLLDAAHNVAAIHDNPIASAGHLRHMVKALTQ